MASPDFYEIKNWSKFQHYKDRNPPWIKLHVEILASEDWVTLADASKLLAIVCMVVAAKNEGRIPNNPAYLKRVAYLDKTPDLTPLIKCGFLSNPLADASERKQRQADARPEAEAEAEADIHTVDTRAKGTRLANDWKPSEADRDYAATLGYRPDEIDAEAVEFFDYFTGEDARQPVKKSWPRAWQRWVRQNASSRFAKRARAGKSQSNRPGSGSVFAALSQNLDAESLGGSDQPGGGMGRGFDEDRMGDGTPGDGQAESASTGGQIIDADDFRRVPEGAGETEADDQGSKRINGGYSADVSVLRRGTTEVPGGRGEARSGNAEKPKPVVARMVGTQGAPGPVRSAAETAARGFDERPDLPSFLARQQAVR